MLPGCTMHVLAVCPCGLPSLSFAACPLNARFLGGRLQDVLWMHGHSEDILRSMRVAMGNPQVKNLLPSSSKFEGPKSHAFRGLPVSTPCKKPFIQRPFEPRLPRATRVNRSKLIINIQIIILQLSTLFARKHAIGRFAQLYATVDSGEAYSRSYALGLEEKMEGVLCQKMRKDPEGSLLKSKCHLHGARRLVWLKPYFDSQ